MKQRKGGEVEASKWSSKYLPRPTFHLLLNPLKRLSLKLWPESTRTNCHPMTSHRLSQFFILLFYYLSQLPGDDALAVPSCPKRLDPGHQCGALPPSPSDLAVGKALRPGRCKSTDSRNLGRWWDWDWWDWWPPKAFGLIWIDVQKPLSNLFLNTTTASLASSIWLLSVIELLRFFFLPLGPPYCFVFRRSSSCSTS